MRWIQSSDGYFRRRSSAAVLMNRRIQRTASLLSRSVSLVTCVNNVFIIVHYIAFLSVHLQNKHRLYLYLLGVSGYAEKTRTCTSVHSAIKIETTIQFCYVISTSTVTSRTLSNSIILHTHTYMHDNVRRHRVMVILSWLVRSFSCARHYKDFHSSITIYTHSAPAAYIWSAIALQHPVSFRSSASTDGSQLATHCQSDSGSPLTTDYLTDRTATVLHIYMYVEPFLASCVLWRAGIAVVWFVGTVAHYCGRQYSGW